MTVADSSSKTRLILLTKLTYSVTFTEVIKQILPVKSYTQQTIGNNWWIFE